MGEAAQLEEGPRVKFSSEWLGDFSKILCKDSSRRKVDSLSTEMADCLWELEQLGMMPVLPDGKVGGNAAALTDIDGHEYMLVSKSGKMTGRMDPKQDTCLVESFDAEGWSGKYYSQSEDVVPTSDTPLHWHALKKTCQYDWPSFPRVVLHGHAFETDEAAEKYDLPISKEETLFSTPEDTNALMKLLESYPYPDHNIFIRKGHGFLVLGTTLENALNSLRSLKDV